MTFESFLRAHGLIPRAVAADGRIRSCGTQDKPRSRNGRYMLAPDGGFGWCQNWATMDAVAVWRPERATVSAPRYDRELARENERRMREDRARASAEAAAAYRGMAPLRGGHPYLDRKGLGVEGCASLRLDERGRLVAPLYDARGRLLSLQRIDSDGGKRYWPGAPVKGGRLLLRRDTASMTLLCEGLATGLALYAAIPAAEIVVAFTAGNLEEVARSIRPRALVVVAADNDHGTEGRIGANPGIDYAARAASALGCGVMLPDGIEGTDWCDFRQELVRRRIEQEAARRDRRGRPPSDAQIRREIDGALLRYALQASAAVRRTA